MFGENDFETWCKKNNSTLLDEWDYVNNSKKPSEYSYGSHSVVNWICKKCGYKYQKDIHSRAQGTGCANCSKIKFEHLQPLSSMYPNLLCELDTNKNIELGIDASNVSCGSTQKIWWKCDNNHSYDMTIFNKLKSTGCPICRNKRIIPGVNDLKTWCKDNDKLDILEDWDYTKNQIKPENVSFGSNKIAFWKCHKCGFEWKTRINSLTINGTRCSKCSRRLSSSFPEQAVYYYIKKVFPDAINGDRQVLKGLELDIYIPSIKVGIEYDGLTWHQLNKDLLKNIACKNSNIRLIRIRERGCESIDNCECYYYEYQDWDSLNKIIIDIISIIGDKTIEVNIQEDNARIKESFYNILKDNSLQIKYPKIAKEFHPTKNGFITPDMIIAESHDKYYWLCPNCGNEYLASVKNRVRVNSSCPICGNIKKARSQMAKVINLDTKEIFDNINEAAKKYNVEKGSISACCRGITKTAFGYHWAYLNGQKKQRQVKQKQQRKIINLDTLEVFDTLADAIEKTHIHNISACCNGKRAKAGGYHWAFYIEDGES